MDIAEDLGVKKRRAENARRLVEMAEKKIQAILLELVNDHGLQVDHVEVDTRNFANLKTEITVRLGATAWTASQGTGN